MDLGLHTWLLQAPAWLMVLFRLTGIFIAAPIFSDANVFRQVKIFLALGLSFCVYPMLLTHGSASAAFIDQLVHHQLSPWLIIADVGRELLIGYVIGYGASLPLTAMQMGGYLIDEQLGLALGGVFNPQLQEQTGIIGQFFFLLATALFVILGGHRIILAALLGSFHHIPLGGFVVDGSLIHLVIGLVATCFDLAVRVAAPLLCLVFLETVTMGFLARTVPQINILSVGFPVRIIIGMVLLIVTLTLAASVYRDVMHDMLWNLMRFFGT